MIAIVVSCEDYASEHVGEQLLDLLDWTAHEDDDRPDGDGGGAYYTADGFELRAFDDLHIELSNPAEAFSANPDLLVFVSRHSGETGELLTGHFTGNFGEAEYGGDDHTLSETAPSALSVFVGALEAHAPAGYDVGIEGTHHGPTGVECPSLFAELGSGEEQWEDPDGARAVAQAVLSLRGVDPHRDRQIVGVGGGHYAPRFGRVVRETPWAVGHVASDWQLEAMPHPGSDTGRDVLRQAFERSGAEHALFDGDHPAVERAVEELGYRVVTETWLREVGDQPLDLVAALEDRLSTVEAGLRFGAMEAAPDEFTVVDLPDDLLAEAQGVDPDAVREAVSVNTVAFETVESGTRARGRAAVVERDDRASLVETLASILREKYDDVEVREEAVVAREKTFDPEKAKRLGVPEGPKFGMLASGQAVTVDGEEIPPGAVRSEREERFPR